MKISQRIIDYSIRYYLRYYPSPKKLELKLVMKFWPNSEKWKKYWGISEDEIRFIIDEKLKNIIQEEEVIQSKIRVYKNKGKSKFYIKQKLFERQEKKELINEFLEEAFLEWERENILREYEKLKPRFEKQKIIEKLLRKWFRYDDVRRLVE